MYFIIYVKFTLSMRNHKNRIERLTESSALKEFENPDEIRSKRAIIWLMNYYATKCVNIQKMKYYCKIGIERNYIACHLFLSNYYKKNDIELEPN